MPWPPGATLNVARVVGLFVGAQSGRENDPHPFAHPSKPVSPNAHGGRI